MQRSCHRSTTVRWAEGGQGRDAAGEDGWIRRCVQQVRRRVGGAREVDRARRRQISPDDFHFRRTNYSARLDERSFVSAAFANRNASQNMRARSLARTFGAACTRERRKSRRWWPREREATKSKRWPRLMSVTLENVARPSRACD